MKKLIAALLAASLLLLTACGGSAEPEDTGISQDTLSSIKQYVEDGISNEIAPMVSTVTVVEVNDAVSVSIRTVAVGGIYLAPVASATVPRAIEKTDALGLEIEAITVSEYTESTSGGISNMIAWRTHDGVIGTFSDDSGDAPIVESNITLEDLMEYYYEPEVECFSLNFTIDSLIKVLSEETERNFSIAEENSADHTVTIVESFMHCELLCHTDEDSNVAAIFIRTKAQNATVEATWKKVCHEVEQLSKKMVSEAAVVSDYTSGEYQIHAVVAKDFEIEGGWA